jgi:hypothetical protein
VPIMARGGGYAWIDLVVIGLIFLLAGVIIGARRQREPYLNRLDLQAWKMGSLSATAGDAERDQQPLQEADPGVAMKTMFSTGPHTFSQYRRVANTCRPFLSGCMRPSVRTITPFCPWPRPKRHSRNRTSNSTTAGRRGASASLVSRDCCVCNSISHLAPSGSRCS